MVAVRLLLFSLMLSGCAEATEILLRVSTDYAIPTDANRLRITVSVPADADRILHDREYALPQEAQLPGTLDLVAPDEGSQTIHVALSLSRDQVLLVQREAVVTFLPRRSVELRLALERICENVVTCARGQTCVEGSCRDARVQPDTLDPIGSGDDLASADGRRPACPAAAGIALCETFEDPASLQKWTAMMSGSGAVSLDPSGAHRGAASLHLGAVASSTTPQSAVLSRSFGNPANPTYARFFLRLSRAALDEPQIVRFVRLEASNASFDIEKGPAPESRVHFVANGFAEAGFLRADEWMCVQWKFDPAASIPQVQLRFDDADPWVGINNPIDPSIAPITRIVLGNAMLGANPFDAWIDDVVIADHLIGCAE